MLYETLDETRRYVNPATTIRATHVWSPVNQKNRDHHRPNRRSGALLDWQVPQHHRVTPPKARSPSRRQLQVCPSTERDLARVQTRRTV